jgi:hypothetical protein
VKGVVVRERHSARAIEVLLEVQLATEYLHAQEGKDKEEKEQKEGQVDEGVHGLDEDLHDHLHGLEGS